MLRRIVCFKFMASDMDGGILALRVLGCLSLFMKHGYEKIFHFSQMAPNFTDPLHLGHVPTLIIAMISDSICSLLIAFGLATRWACLFVFCNIFVAWSVRHDFAFFEHAAGDHGELIVLYLVIVIATFIAGPGKYSLDFLLERRWSDSGVKD